LGKARRGRVRWGKEWIRGAERVVGRENNGLYHGRRRESEECKNRNKKIVMVTLIIQE
jgi:hypothetical protein